MTKVYWIRNDQEMDILTEGYVGITGRALDYRMREHQQFGVMKPEDTIEVIYEVDTWAEAKVLEKRLRPESNIGRNIATGGQSMNLGGSKKGITKTKQHRQRISAAHTGKKHSAEHKKNNAAAQKVIAQRPDYVNHYQGKTHSKETRQKIKDNMQRALEEGRGRWVDNTL
jgi:hypothetical protein